MEVFKDALIEIVLSVITIIVLPYIVSILKSVRDDKRLARILELVEWAVAAVEKYAKDGEISYEDREDYARELIDKYRGTYNIKRSWLTYKVVNYAIKRAVNKLRKTFKSDKAKKDALPTYEPGDNVGDLK